MLEEADDLTVDQVEREAVEVADVGNEWAVGCGNVRILECADNCRRRGVHQQERQVGRGRVGDGLQAGHGRWDGFAQERKTTQSETARKPLTKVIEAKDAIAETRRRRAV